MSILDEIEKHMQEKKISKYRLSKMSGLRATTISEVFSHRNPRLDTLLKIANALNLQVKLETLKQTQI